MELRELAQGLWPQLAPDWNHLGPRDPDPDVTSPGAVSHFGPLLAELRTPQRPPINSGISLTHSEMHSSRAPRAFWPAVDTVEQCSLTRCSLSRVMLGRCLDQKEARDGEGMMKRPESLQSLAHKPAEIYFSGLWSSMRQAFRDWNNCFFFPLH